MNIYIGIDLGTSGCRACAIDDDSNIIALSTRSLPKPVTQGDLIIQDARIWWYGVEHVLRDLLKKINPLQVKAISVDGTSGTILVTDSKGSPLSPALMYNDTSSSEQANLIKKIAPENSAAHGESSGLSKLLFLQQLHPQAKHALHQADWISAKFSGNYKICDTNNALKTGYDAVNNKWPDWFDKLNVRMNLLPKVIEPGERIGCIDKSTAKQFNLPDDVSIIAGTTDSIAAFIATGASQPGEAVTSIGSTLVLKIITDKPVFSPEHGVYSHKFGQYWLAGGASNTGGAVLKKYFTDNQLIQLTPLLKPLQPTGLNYYPLTKPGERFPINDPTLAPKLEPLPGNDVTFFQAILEGISQIEYFGYQKLHELGAPYPVSVKTTGGGSVNSALTEIRQNMLKVPLNTAQYTEACFGAAKLALQGTYDQVANEHIEQRQ